MPRKRLDPLPSTAFQILLALADRELHGYGIMRQVAEQSEDRFRLGPATLYGSIQALLEVKFIEEVDPPAGDAADERRRYYRITASGRRTARAEAERMVGTLRVARAKKLLGGERV